MNMMELNKGCVAVRLTFFFILASAVTFEAYSPLYLRQLGFSPSDIGLTILPMTISSPFLIPLVGFLADKYRVRKNILYASVLLTVLVYLAHLLPLIRHQSCHTLPRNSSSYAKQQLGNTSFKLQTNDSNSGATTAPESDFPLVSRNLPAKETSKRHLVSSKQDVEKRSPMRMVKETTFDTRERQGTWRNPLSNTAPSNNPLIERPVSILVGMIILRTMYDILKRMMVPFMNVAAIQQTQKLGTSFGSYRCWGDIGGSISLFVVGILASHISYRVCGEASDGYFTTFIWTAVQTSLSLVVYRLIVFEYSSHTVCDWSEIRKALLNRHFIVMMFMSWFTGFCLCFQTLWEFWYIAQLSGGPLIMGIVGLLREPFLAAWFYISGTLINKFGELKTVCVALFIYSSSFMALSFVGIPWLVLVFDVFQSAGYAFSNSSLVVHFSKTGSAASSGVIQSIFNSLFYGFGLGSGGTIMGVLFNNIGPRTTLRCYSLAAAIVLVLFGAYVLKGKNGMKYERVVNSASEDEKESGDENESSILKRNDVK